MVDRYVDRAHAESFFQADGQEAEASILLHVPASVAYERWTNRCWFGDSLNSRKEIKSGDFRRTVHGIEHVTSIARPRSSNSTDSIASIHFKLKNQGIWLDGYHAMVSFIPDRSNPSYTLVLWAVKFDPSRTSIFVCCGGTMLRMLMRNYMHRQLQTLV